MYRQTLDNIFHFKVWIQCCNADKVKSAIIARLWCIFEYKGIGWQNHCFFSIYHLISPTFLFLKLLSVFGYYIIQISRQVDITFISCGTSWTIIMKLLSNDINVTNSAIPDYPFEPEGPKPSYKQCNVWYVIVLNTLFAYDKNMIIILSVLVTYKSIKSPANDMHKERLAMIL